MGRVQFLLALCPFPPPPPPHPPSPHRSPFHLLPDLHKNHYLFGKLNVQLHNLQIYARMITHGLTNAHFFSQVVVVVTIFTYF